MCSSHTGCRFLTAVHALNHETCCTKLTLHRQSLLGTFHHSYTLRQASLVWAQLQALMGYGARYSRPHDGTNASAGNASPCRRACACVKSRGGIPLRAGVWRSGRGYYRRLAPPSSRGSVRRAVNIRRRGPDGTKAVAARAILRALERISAGGGRSAVRIRFAPAGAPPLANRCRGRPCAHGRR